MEAFHRRLPASGEKAHANRRSPLGALVATAGLLVALLAAYDAFHLLAVRPASEAAWERIAAACLALTLVSAAVAAIAAVELVVVWTYGAISRRPWGSLGPLMFPVAGTLVASPLLWLLARQPFIGNRYRDSPVAAWGPWVVFTVMVVAGIAATWLAARLLVRLSSPDAGRAFRAASTAILIGLLTLLLVTDTVWYAGWYPLVHSVLSLGTAVIAHALLAVGVLTSVTVDRTAGIAARVVLVALCAAVPVSLLNGGQTTGWRVSTGTLFASRVLTPVLRLHAPSIALDDLDRLPDVSLAEVTHDPSVTGTPQAVAGNGLLVTVDTLRFDAVGPRGMAASLTPNVDAFFARGQVFERAYSQYASTRHSVRALVESRYGAQDHPETDDLINRLRDYGYQVVGVLPTDLKTFVTVERYNFTRIAFYEDASTVPGVLEELTRDLPAEKRFIWVHLYQPHDPYEPLPEFASGRSGRSRYDGEVRWTDHQFAQIVDRFSSEGDIVVFGSDHGEEFGEHGGTLHGRTAYDETLRVPLAIRVPGVVPLRRHDLVANVDIAPTILAALGIPVPDSFEGYDLLGRASVAPRGRIVYSETVTNAIAALQDTHKFVYWPELDLWEAYDLDADPRELRNIADRPEVMARGRELVGLFRLLAYVLPGLDAIGPVEYARWLGGRLKAQHPPHALSRWAAYRLGTGHAGNEEVRSLFAAALQQEQEPLARLALVENLGSVPPDTTLDVAYSEMLDTGLLVALLGRPEFATGESTLARALEHPVAAVRAAAARRLARERPLIARTTMLDRHAGDAAIVRGLLTGLSDGASDLEPGFFRRFVGHDNVEVRVAALRGVRLQETQEAVPLLKQRRLVETSPSAVEVLLAGLLELDRQEGLAALRRELEMPLLSDYKRATLIAEWNVDQEANHLVDLFTRSESGPFRNYLFTIVSGLRAPREKIDTLVAVMNANAFEPGLRARITRYMQRSGSQAPQNQDGKAGVPRQP